MVEAKISQIIEDAVAELGYGLVRVQFSGGQTGRNQLQIMAEPNEDREMTVEDCQMLSRHISTLLDVDDPIPSAYVLEVSSPGIDRPLVAADDFRRFAGFDARLEAQQPIDGRKRFKGKLLGLDADDIRIETDTGTFSVPVDNIATAKLLMTDDLIKQPAMARPQG